MPDISSVIVPFSGLVGTAMKERVARRSRPLQMGGHLPRLGDKSEKPAQIYSTFIVGSVPS